LTVAWTPYSTARPLMDTLPGWVPADDQERIASYLLYEQIYWGHPTTFKLTARGLENSPIYIPSARTIVDTTARYVGKGLGYNVKETLDPSLTMNEQDRAGLVFALDTLHKREKFFSNFHSNKLYGIMRGDWLFHVFADPAKADGKRISIQGVDPTSYFPIYEDDTDPSTLVGVALADLVAVGDKEFVRRLLYRQELNDDGSKTIFRSLFYFKPEGGEWLKLDAEPEVVTDVETLSEEQLDPLIQAIPVYHIRNNPTANRPFGSSEVRGIERLFAAINQGISDEELSLALDGLGMYATEGGPPRDADGNELPAWPLGPGRVVETDPDSNFRRISGISTVAPYLDHVNWLRDAAREATGANDVAVGKVDVSVAESGIALAIRMDPLLSRVDYYDLDATDTLSNMWYDLQTGWYPAYERLTFPSVMVEPTLGNKLPVNRKEKFDELVLMLTNGVITAEFFLTETEKLGYKFPDGAAAMAAAAQAEKAASTAAADPFANRAGGELGAAGNGGPVPAEEVPA